MRRNVWGIRSNTRISYQQRWSSCVSSAMTAQPLLLPQNGIVDVSYLARVMRMSIREYAAKNAMKLVGILAQDGPCREDAQIYSDIVGNTFQEDGIQYEEIRVNGLNVPDFIAQIETANSRRDVHGILVYYPIFKHLEPIKGPYKNQLTGVYCKTLDDYLRDHVAIEKDVEGLRQNHDARWLFRIGSTFDADISNNVYPCTALSVLKILNAFEVNFTGCIVTIINRSEILGRPLAAMLANQGAHVFSIDENSVVLQFRPGGKLRRLNDMNLEKCLKESSIVVSAVPSPTFTLPLNFIMPNSIVINVSEYENVPEAIIHEVPNVIFIPRVGKVTVAALEHNLVELHKKSVKK
jgi:methylenetetrahydrofolate dehydrogenase (NAD+)